MFKRKEGNRNELSVAVENAEPTACSPDAHLMSVA
jgi:hypothetical protein